MKRFSAIIIIVFSGQIAMGQTTSTGATSATISSLAVPNSPAFSITDITPTLVQDPTTPKAFALGVAQSFQQSGSAFPNNYAAQFAPIWWVNPKKINVYSYLGLPVPPKTGHASAKENIFAGIKFTTISVAFINKDLIPDTSKATQNVFSIGLHTTLIKIYGKKHARDLANAINNWEADARGEIDTNARYIDSISRPPVAGDTAKTRAVLKNWSQTQTADDLVTINKLIAEKPYLSWDIAGAWAVYGTNNNQQVKTGRAGVWTSISSYIPFPNSTTDYFNVNLLGRYILDNFQKNAQGVIGTANNTDLGFNLGFEFNRLTISVESLYRYINGVPNTENRTVGVISVKLTDKIFINGTFGKDFAGPNKLISAFGINWGFGNEQVILP